MRGERGGAPEVGARRRRARPREHEVDGGADPPLGVAEGRLAVVYLGVDPEVAVVAPEKVAALRAKLGPRGQAGRRLGRAPDAAQEPRRAPASGGAALTQAQDLVYVVAGDGHARPALEDEARRLGITDRVRFVGAVGRGEVGAYYRLAQVHALVPRPKPEDNELESFGLCYVEAGLCGVPSIGSRSGGVPEAVRDGETGLLVEAEDEAQVASALERLLEDGALRDRLGAAASLDARDRFSWERCARETRDALARVALAGERNESR